MTHWTAACRLRPLGNLSLRVQHDNLRVQHDTEHTSSLIAQSLNARAIFWGRVLHTVGILA